MKLLYVTTMLPFGPGEGFLVPEATELAKTEEVAIVPMHPRGPLLHRDMLPLRRLVVEQPLLSRAIVVAAVAEAARAPTRVLRLLFALLGSRSAQLVAKNLLVLPKGLWLSRYARRLGIQHIHAHWASTPSTMAMIAGEASGIPWSFTAHRWDITEDNLLARKLRSACFARVISERGAAALRTAARNARVRPIHVGVEIAEPAVVSSRQGNRLHVVVAANLVEVKGHVYLLRALDRLRRDGTVVQLDIIGEGHLRQSLERTATTLGIRDLVTFHGALSHEDLLERLRSHTWDVCVLPSIVTAAGEQEGIPVSLLESMSAGVPVVATSTGSIPELVGDGAGVLVPPNDPDALADALARLATQPETRASLGSGGRERVMADFDVRSTTRRLVEEMRHCSEGRG